MNSKFVELSKTKEEMGNLIREDIQIAITVICRCLPPYKNDTSKYAVCRKIDLSFLVLDSYHFDFATLTGVNFEGSSLKNTNFHEAIWIGSNFKGANLEGANLSGVDGLAACFDRAILNNASLHLFDGESAGFKGASLINANIDSADLSKANFEDTIFDETGRTELIQPRKKRTHNRVRLRGKKIEKTNFVSRFIFKRKLRRLLHTRY